MNVTVLNPGTRGSQPVTIQDFTSDPSDFIVRGRPHTTCARKQVLKPGQRCVIALIFVPAAVGLRSGTLTVSDSADTVSPTVQLSGLGKAATLTSEPPVANFGAVMVSQAKSIKLRLANKTPVFIHVTNVTAAEPFSAGGECRGMIRPGASCRLSLKFAPVAPADAPPGPTVETGTLTFTETPQITQSVDMSGTAVIRRFGTLAPHAKLPTGARCAQLVSASAWEPRPENGVANHTLPTAPELQSFYGEPLFSGNVPASDFATVDGNYSGTTDMLLRWAACKWGIDEDVLRAQAANESNWTQSSNGDLRTDRSQCMAGQWDGWTGSFCNQSYGLMQIKVFDYNAWPEAWNSTSFNVDFRGAYQRACMNGEISYLIGQSAPGRPSYPNGTTDQMLWGCIGEWFSGGWYDSGAASYIKDVRRLLAGKPWLGWWSGPTSAVSISSPTDGATVSGVVPISVEVSPSVNFVNFQIDGSYAASSPPNSHDWNTTRMVLNGNHSIAVDAFDTKDTIVGHAFVNVNVSN